MSHACFCIASQLWLLGRRLVAVSRLDSVENALVERFESAVLKCGHARNELHVVVIEENERLGGERLGALNERIVGGGSVGGGAHKKNGVVRKTRALGVADRPSLQNAQEVRAERYVLIA